MAIRTTFLMAAILAIGGLPAFAADLETQVIDKNCFIEIFEDDNFDVDDPHVVLQGPKEYASLKNIAGKDWSNDIESVIVGSNATVHAFEDKDFKGTELAFTPGQRVKNLGKLDMANDIESLKITCGK
ncbi:MAG TPA: hypothetical protein VM842_09295 [Nitrospira sp.]|nr:hypothetical protein [Nitrospira sp.]